MVDGRRERCPSPAYLILSLCFALYQVQAKGFFFSKKACLYSGGILLDRSTALASIRLTMRLIALFVSCSLVLKPSVSAFI